MSYIYNMLFPTRVMNQLDVPVWVYVVFRDGLEVGIGAQI